MTRLLTLSLVICSVVLATVCHGSRRAGDLELPDHPRNTHHQHPHRHRHRHHHHNRHHDGNLRSKPPASPAPLADVEAPASIAETDGKQNGDTLNAGSYGDGVKNLKGHVGVKDLKGHVPVTEAVLPYGWSTPAAFLPMTTEEAPREEPQSPRKPLPNSHDTEPVNQPVKQEQYDLLPTSKSNPPSPRDKHASAEDEEDTDEEGEEKSNGNSDKERQEQSTGQIFLTTEATPVLISSTQMLMDKGSLEADQGKPSRRRKTYRYTKLVNRPRWHFRREHEDRDDNVTTAPETVRGNPFVNRAKNNRKLDKARRNWPLNRPKWHTDTDFQRKSISPENVENENSSPRVTEDMNLQRESKETSNKTGSRVDEDEQKRKETRRPSERRSKLSETGKHRSSKKCGSGCSKLGNSLFQARELHKQVLKAQLLDKLRLVPTFTKRPLPPKLPDQVFPDSPQRDQTDEDDHYYAKPTQLLVFGRDLGPRHRLRKDGTGSYQFGVTGKVKGDVTSADLWVYKMKDANDLHEQTLLITELRFSKRQRLRERSLVARLDTHVQEGWVRFDVTRLVQRWMKAKLPSSLQMLAIRCKTCHRTNYRAIFGVKSNFRPVLVVQEHRHGDRRRNKRRTCDPNTGCCKYDITVHFHDLGVHEIFHPRSLRTAYCYGTCERPDAFHYNHTLIMQRMRYASYTPVNETMRSRLLPCCVPVVLREAAIMHYINDGLDTQVSYVPNLLVDKCGCA